MELNEAILKSIQILNEERTRPTVSFEPVIGALSRHSLHAERQKNYNVLGAGLGNPGNFGNPRGPRESSRNQGLENILASQMKLQLAPQFARYFGQYGKGAGDFFSMLADKVISSRSLHSGQIERRLLHRALSPACTYPDLRVCSLN
jgi:hypothetical protein